LLISKDVRGNFDNRVTQALLLYMGGKGGFATKDLDETVPEYKSTAIGPYLALVAANAVMRKKPKKALGYFDWARLILPGTIVEEAALRRSLMITTATNDLDRSVELARQYLWRFPKSPYAAQVADLFVDLVNNNFGKITKDQINSILGMMDGRRKQEVFLRIARKAAVGGKLELAKWAASQAIALDDGRNDNQMKLAKLYMGLSDLTNGDLQKAKDVFSQIPDRVLGPDERRLRDAAEFILSEVERKPRLDSLTQAEKDTPTNNEMPVSPPQAAGTPPPAQSGGKAASDAKGAKVLDANAKQAEAIDKFLSQGKTQLNAIDEMIKKGDR
jgi:chemotaxis protein MotC